MSVKLGAFANTVLGKILGPKKQEVIEEWREMHNEDLHYLCSSANIIWVIKSKMMR
jgi:hypothetical protein